MYTLLHCNIFSLKCPTTHWNRAPKFKSAFFTDSNLWKLSIGFVLRLYHISFNVNLASQATKPFPQSCGAKYFSQQSPFIFLAQKSLYLANTFLGPAPRGVAALVSVSDDKIQITMLIPGRSALSRRGSMSIQNLNFLKVSYPGTPCILSSSSSSTYIIYREVCLTFISLLKNIVNLFKWLIVKLNICQILLLLLLCITTIVIFIFQCQPSLRDCLCHPKFDNFANCMQKFTLTSTRQWCLEEGVSPKSHPGRCWQRGRCTFAAVATVLAQTAHTCNSQCTCLAALYFLSLRRIELWQKCWFSKKLMFHSLNGFLTWKRPFSASLMQDWRSTFCSRSTLPKALLWPRPPGVTDSE